MTTTAAEDQATGIPRVTVLHGHTTMDTAHLTEDYPYGRRLRCQRREWLEYNPKHGYRFVTQTTDPRRAYEHWNAPKPSTYAEWAVMTEDPNPGPTFGHIFYLSVGIWGPSPAYHVRLALSGVLSQLDEKEAKFYRVFLRMGREKANPSAWARWADAIAWLAANRDGAGEVPSAEALLDGARLYLDERDHAAARAQILTGFDPSA
jgi:hypothetical protein